MHVVMCRFFPRQISQDVVVAKFGLTFVSVRAFVGRSIGLVQHMQMSPQLVREHTCCRNVQPFMFRQCGLHGISVDKYAWLLP